MRRIFLDAGILKPWKRRTLLVLLEAVGAPRTLPISWFHIFLIWLYVLCPQMYLRIMLVPIEARICIYITGYLQHAYTYISTYVYIYIYIYILGSRFSRPCPSGNTPTPHPPCFKSATSHRDRGCWGRHPRNCRRF